MRTRILFGAISDVPRKVLLGNAFNSRHLKEINTKAGLVRLFNYRPSPILANRNESIAPISIPHHKIQHVDSIGRSTKKPLHLSSPYSIDPTEQSVFHTRNDRSMRAHTRRVTRRVIKSVSNNRSERNHGDKRISTILYTRSEFMQPACAPSKTHVRFILVPVPDIIDESNLPTFDNGKTNCPTPILFNLEITATHPDCTITIEPINGTNYNSRVTAESIPVSAIQPEPDIETVAALSSNAIDDREKANGTIESKSKNNWRHNINIATQYNRYKQQLEEVLDPFADMHGMDNLGTSKPQYLESNSNRTRNLSSNTLPCGSETRSA